jgi:hypothetical protein
MLDSSALRSDATTLESAQAGAPGAGARRRRGMRWGRRTPTTPPASSSPASASPKPPKPEPPSSLSRGSIVVMWCFCLRACACVPIATFLRSTASPDGDRGGINPSCTPEMDTLLGLVGADEPLDPDASPPTFC